MGPFYLIVWFLHFLLGYGWVFSFGVGFLGWWFPSKEKSFMLRMGPLFLLRSVCMGAVWLMMGVFFFAGRFRKSLNVPPGKCAPTSCAPNKCAPKSVSKLQKLQRVPKKCVS